METGTRSKVCTAYYNHCDNFLIILYFTFSNFIIAVKHKNAAILSVDHKAAPPGIGTKNIGAVGTKHPIYIGGHPNLESDKPLKGSMSRAQFVGCIKDVYINEKPYSLNPSQTHGKVMADVCPTI